MTLIFYEVEEKMHLKTYKKKLNYKTIPKYHNQICKNLNIKTKLKIDNRTDGYFDTDTNIIGLPSNATLGLLIHEIGHAYEYKKFNETYHKDRLFQIINEINIFAEKAIL